MEHAQDCAAAASDFALQRFDKKVWKGSFGFHFALDRQAAGGEKKNGGGSVADLLLFLLLRWWRTRFERR
jgi:hypothetical protein